METDSDMKSDYSSLFKDNFNDNLPYLEITKSIELGKSAIKHFKDNELAPDIQPRMLFTPLIGGKKSKIDKVRKINPSPTPNEKESKSKSKVRKLQINPSINFKKGIAPALKPSLLTSTKPFQKNRGNNTM